MVRDFHRTCEFLIHVQQKKLQTARRVIMMQSGGHDPPRRQNMISLKNLVEQTVRECFLIISTVMKECIKNDTCTAIQLSRPFYICVAHLLRLSAAIKWCRDKRIEKASIDVMNRSRTKLNNLWGTVQYEWPQPRFAIEHAADVLCRGSFQLPESIVSLSREKIARDTIASTEPVSNLQVRCRFLEDCGMLVSDSERDKNRDLMRSYVDDFTWDARGVSLTKRGLFKISLELVPAKSSSSQFESINRWTISSIEFFMSSDTSEVPAVLPDDDQLSFLKQELGGRLNDIKQKLHEARIALKRSKKKEYYKILGVSHAANEREIKKAYRKAAVKWHPDKWSSKSESEKKMAENNFKDINAAFEALSEAKSSATKAHEGSGNKYMSKKIPPILSLVRQICDISARLQLTTLRTQAEERLQLANGAFGVSTQDISRTEEDGSFAIDWRDVSGKNLRLRLLVGRLSSGDASAVYATIHLPHDADTTDRVIPIDSSKLSMHRLLFDATRTFAVARLRSLETKLARIRGKDCSVRLVDASDVGDRWPALHVTFEARAAPQLRISVCGRSGAFEVREMGRRQPRLERLLALSNERSLRAFIAPANFDGELLDTFP